MIALGPHHDWSWVSWVVVPRKKQNQGGGWVGGVLNKYLCLRFLTAGKSHEKVRQILLLLLIITTTTTTTTTMMMMMMMMMMMIIIITIMNYYYY